LENSPSGKNIGIASSLSSLFANQLFAKTFPFTYADLMTLHLPHSFVHSFVERPTNEIFTCYIYWNRMLQFIPSTAAAAAAQSMNIVNKKGLKDNAYNFTAELCLSDLIRCKLSETPEQISNNLSMLTAFPILQQQPAAAAADIGQSKARQKLRELLTSCSGYFIYTHTHTHAKFLSLCVSIMICAATE